MATSSTRRIFFGIPKVSYSDAVTKDPDAISWPSDALSSVGHLRSPKELWGRFYPPRQGLKFESCLGRYGFPSRVRKGKGAIAFWVGPNVVVWARYAF
ncbi:hypothetical protein Tco_0231365 [Tanacetum coccineum]